MGILLSMFRHKNRLIYLQNKFSSFNIVQKKSPPSRKKSPAKKMYCKMKLKTDIAWQFRELMLECSLRTKLCNEKCNGRPDSIVRGRVRQTFICRYMASPFVHINDMKSFSIWPKSFCTLLSVFLTSLCPLHYFRL